MSRIGRQPIPVPAGVTVAIEPERVTVNGPKGELSERIHRDITVEQVGRRDRASRRPTDRGEHRALHGLTRTLVANMVQGVTDGFEKRLEIQGVGYRAQLRGRDLELALGYSHPVSVKAPDGIEFEVPQPTRIVVTRRLQAAGRRDGRASSASSASPSPTRARGSATRASTSPGRSVSEHDRADQARSARLKRRRRVRAKVRGTARAPADLGVPLQPRHLRPADRRRRRAHAGRGQLDRGRAARR